MGRLWPAITLAVLLTLSYCGMIAPAAAQKDEPPVLVNPVVKLVWKKGADWQHCTGFYIGSDKIVTAAHCIDTIAGGFGIEDVDGKKLKQTAKLVAYDDRLDFALLEIAFNQTAPIRPIEVDCSVPKVGTEIQIEGFPTILGFTTTFGRVTSLPKDLTPIVDPNPWPSTSVITVDAMLDHGNSGGPVIDSETGKVIGTAVAYFKPFNAVYSLVVPASAYCKYL